jgi:hypothetical protein
MEVSSKRGCSIAGFLAVIQDTVVPSHESRKESFREPGYISPVPPEWNRIERRKKTL